MKVTYRGAVGTRAVVATAIAAVLSASNVVTAPAGLAASRRVAPSVSPSATQLVSVGMNGAEADGTSAYPFISDGDRYVTFMSGATNLVPNDTNAADDIFVRDLVAGTTQRVSVDEAGAELPSGAFLSGVSSDGRYVLFSTQDAAVATDSNGASDVYRRDTTAGITELVSATPLGNAGNGFSIAHAVSRNGRFVAFETSATDIGPVQPLHPQSEFLRDFTAGTTKPIAPQGMCDYCTMGIGDISDDGQYVLADITVSTYHVTSMLSNVRVSDGQQTPIAASNPRGCSVAFARYRPSSGDALYGTVCNYALNDVGINIADLGTGVSRFIDLGVGLTGGAADLDAGEHRLAFSALMPGWGVNANPDEVLVSDLTSSTVFRVSAAYDGGLPDGMSTNPNVGTSSVVFESGATNLVSSDTNDQWDIFVRDLRTAPTFTPPTLVAPDITIVAPLPGDTTTATITPAYRPTSAFDASYRWQTIDGSATSATDYIGDFGQGVIDTVAGTATSIQITINGSQSTAIRQFTVHIATDYMRGFVQDATVTIVPPGVPLQRPVVASWTSSENARLQEIGNYLGVSPNEVQHVAVYLLAYLDAIAQIAPSKVALPPAGSAASYTTTWEPMEYGVLDNVTTTYSLDDADATRYSFALLDYLLAISGH